VGTRIRLVGLLLVGVFVLGPASSVSARSLAGPKISGFSPPAGVVGTAVAVTGSGFTGATDVSFNGVAAAFTVVDDANIQTSVPFGATTGKIAVATPAGSATSTASFRVQPAVSGFSPGWGWAGTVVTISGSAFTGATAVTFHGVGASFTVDSYSRITATVPAGATTGKIKVTTKVGTAASSTAFDVLVAGPGWPQVGYDAANSSYNPNETILTPANVSSLQLAWRDHTGKLGGGRPAGQPAIVNGILYVGSNANLYALDAVSGAPLWSAPAPGSLTTFAAVVDGTVYIGSADRNALYAFDASDGALRWSAPTDRHPAWVVVANGTVYVNSIDAVEAFDAATGARRWSTRPGAPTGFNFGLNTPAVANGFVYVTAFCVSPPCTGPKLFAFDAAGGAVVWSVPVQPSQPSAPSVGNGIVYVNNFDYSYTNEYQYAFDGATGAELWRRDLSGSSDLSWPSTANGVLYVSAGGVLYALDGATGNTIWQSVRTGVDGKPAIANGVVYEGAAEGAMYAFDLTNGALLWHVGLTAPGWPEIANGALYFSSFWKVNSFQLP
jgi:outer membrane protein assembly factor BamB